MSEAETNLNLTQGKQPKDSKSKELYYPLLKGGGGGGAYCLILWKREDLIKANHPQQKTK